MHVWSAMTKSETSGEVHLQEAQDEITCVVPALVQWEGDEWAGSMAQGIWSLWCPRAISQDVILTTYEGKKRQVQPPVLGVRSLRKQIGQIWNLPAHDR